MNMKYNLLKIYIEFLLMNSPQFQLSIGTEEKKPSSFEFPSETEVVVYVLLIYFVENIVDVLLLSRVFYYSLYWK